ncbi:Transposase DDE domain family protein (plasmid) [Rhizobium leguminosarum]|uniref:Transposase DDE domain family protein n=1 Tax=Rhizobium leguminosarum TaxID=384 RepID=A0A2Z4YPG0_RHILE|nr:Transposase DDE domain family protein [Rhizobium leguminosarum]
MAGPSPDLNPGWGETPEALIGWAAPRRKTRGGQPRYSDLAIETTLMLGMVFGLRLRQSEGLLSSVLDMMGLGLPVPDHTTLSRRARTWKPSARSNDQQHVADGPVHVLVDSTGLQIYGAGQWLEEKHGAKSRRGWRKLHLAVDADSGEIIAHSLTNQEVGDASKLEPLLDQIDEEIDQFTADGAYDGTPTYDAVLLHSPGARVVIPPRSNAVKRPNAQACCQRDDHIASMQIDGRLTWQTSTGYSKRALVETAMGRYKGVIGPRLRARSFRAQQTEATIGVTILNRMLACGRPKSVRCETPAPATK